MPLSSNTKNIIIILLWSCLFFFAGNGIIALTHPDEVFYVQTAKEMITHNTWLVPYLFDGPNFEKPIFSYWLLRIAIEFFGLNSFSVRFFPALFATLGVLGVYFLGRTAFADRRKGFYAALILMSSALYVGLARTVFTDMFFAVWIELALIAFYRAYTDNPSKKAGLIAFWVFAGFAVLTKGLPGVVIPVLVVVLFLSLKKDLKFLAVPAFGIGFLAFLIVAVPWYLYMIQKFGQSFIQEFFYNDHIRRIVAAEHPSNDKWFFYPLTMIGLMAPWCIFIGLALMNLYKNIKKDASSLYLFLAIWILVVFCVFQVAHSKLVSYIFPLFPALALLAGDTLRDMIAKQSARNIFIVSGILAPLALIVTAVLGLSVFAHYIVSRELMMGTLVFNLLAFCAVFFFLLRKDGIVTRLTIMLLQIPLVLFFVFLNHASFDNYISTKNSSAYLRNRKIVGPVLCAPRFLRAIRFSSDKPVVLFNMGGKACFFSPHPVAELRSREDIVKFVNDSPERYAVLTKNTVNDLQELTAGAINVKIVEVFGDQYIVVLNKFITFSP